MTTLTSFPPGLHKRQIQIHRSKVCRRFFLYKKDAAGVCHLFAVSCLKAKADSIRKNLPPRDRVSCVRAFEERAATRCCYIAHEKVHGTV